MRISFRNGLGFADATPVPGTVKWWLIAIIGVTYAATIVRTRRVEWLGDVTGDPLSLSRVPAAM